MTAMHPHVHYDALLPADVQSAARQRRAHPSAPFLAVARGEQPTRRPVWMMRQAGRSLPEYRALRADINMLEACMNSEIIAEITMQPVRRYDADAAILFSDIVVPLRAAGVPVDIVAGRGPVLHKPLRTEQDINQLPVGNSEQLSTIVQGISHILKELREDQVLIGFAGAPFTLASYMVEGGPSKNHENTKALMYTQPHLWHELMHKLTQTVILFLRTQVEAGADAIQLFDSWVGHLSSRDYRSYVQPYSTEVFRALAPYNVPMIHFGVGTGELLADMAATGANIVGVDWRVALDVAAVRIKAGLEAENPTGKPEDSTRVLQGNLDPAVLFAGEEIITQHVRRITAEADRAIQRGQARGHIFNLGHGVLPHTDPDVIRRTFEEVHQS